jgi:tRNA(Ile)-lysidine synthase
MKATEQKVIRFIKENNLISEGDRVLIALSGGPDSVFLLHFFNKFKSKYKIVLGAVHINHLLRGNDSDRDEIFCKAICNELDIPIYTVKANVKLYAKRNKYSLEIAGRKIRYDFFEKILSTQKYSKIATAHNADDNAETVLLNLIKGTGINGISGIPVKRDKIIRPILCLSKKEILEYLEDNKFEYRIDESNLSNEYERNFLRNDVIPLIQKNLNPSFEENILNSSLNFQRLNLFLEKILLQLKSDIEIKKNKFLALPVKHFETVDEFLISQLLKTLIDKNFNLQCNSDDLKKIFLIKNKQAGKSEELTNNLLVLKERDKIIITKRKSGKKNADKLIQIGKSIKVNDKNLSINQVIKSKVKISKNKNIEFISGDNINDVFTIRTWQNGDKFYPIGMKGTKKLSDYLNEIKIDSFQKKNQLVLINNGKIVWIMGHRLDDRFKITSQTKRILKLCLN